MRVFTVAKTKCESDEVHDAGRWMSEIFQKSPSRIPPTVGCDISSWVPEVGSVCDPGCLVCRLRPEAPLKAEL